MAAKSRRKLTDRLRANLADMSVAEERGGILVKGEAMAYNSRSESDADLRRFGNKLRTKKKISKGVHQGEGGVRTKKKGRKGHATRQKNGIKR